ncbi:MAG TPA: hypothetical protein VE422_34930 [Terriglobia bacterium]|nr:hypothetical protein [Terriglobia bacterium]
MTTKKKQYYAFTYYRPERELRARAFTSQLHKTRDGLALAELSVALQQAGYTYGGAFLNVPETTHHEEANAVRDSAFTPGADDLIVVATRPPLDDEDMLSRRTIARSHHPVEELLLQELRTVFRICRRNAVVLHEPTNVDRRYRSVQFGEFNGAPMRNSEDESRRSVGYCLFTPQPSQVPCGVLLAFAPGGTESLVFAHLLRTSFAPLFADILSRQQKRLVMVEFLIPSFVPYPSLSFRAEELEARVVADAVL